MCAHFCVLNRLESSPHCHIVFSNECEAPKIPTQYIYGLIILSFGSTNAIRISHMLAGSHQCPSLRIWISATLCHPLMRLRSIWSYLRGRTPSSGYSVRNNTILEFFVCLQSNNQRLKDETLGKKLITTSPFPSLCYILNHR